MLMQKSIDLLDLTPEDYVEVVLNHVMRQEPLIAEKHRLPLGRLIFKLIEKLQVGAASAGPRLVVSLSTRPRLRPCPFEPRLAPSLTEKAPAESGHDDPE